MKRFSILLLIAGLSLLLYPTISDWISELHHDQEIVEYSQLVSQLDSESYNAMLLEAEEYNEELFLRKGLPTYLNDEQMAVYKTKLDITGTGVMAYIDIPSIGIYLPVYHTTDHAELQNGVGHLEGSSLPIGGENTHAILSGHSGLTSSKLFTDIEDMEAGDMFYIHVLNEKLAYKVDLIQVLLPYEIGALSIIDGGDYVTLMTCTPYGVNSHRLLVRGERVVEDLVVEDTPTQLDPVPTFTFDPRPVIVAASVLALIAFILVFYRKEGKQ